MTPEQLLSDMYRYFFNLELDKRNKLLITIFGWKGLDAYKCMRDHRKEMQNG